MHRIYSFLYNTVADEPFWETGVDVMDDYGYAYCDENNWWNIMFAMDMKGEIYRYSKREDNCYPWVENHLRRMTKKRRWTWLMNRIERWADDCMVRSADYLRKTYDYKGSGDVFEELVQAIQVNAVSDEPNGWAIAFAGRQLQIYKERTYRAFSDFIGTPYDENIALDQRDFTKDGYIDENLAVVLVDIHT